MKLPLQVGCYVDRGCGPGLSLRAFSNLRFHGSVIDEHELALTGSSGI